MSNGNPHIVRAKLWTRKTLTISASSTIIFETIAMTSLKSVVYDIDLRRADNTKVKAFNFEVTNVNGDTRSQLYSRRGNGLNVDVNDNVNAGNYELEFINNEVFDVVLTVAKLKL